MNGQSFSSPEFNFGVTSNPSSDFPSITVVLISIVLLSQLRKRGKVT